MRRPRQQDPALDVPGAVGENNGRVIDRVGDLAVIEKGTPPRQRSSDAAASLRYRRIGTGLAISDAACIVAALLATHQLTSSRDASPSGFLIVLLVAPILWVTVFNAFALYGLHHLSASEAFRRIISATFVGIVLLMLTTVWWPAPLSRGWVAATWGISLVLELGTRRLWHWQIRRFKRDGRLGLKTLVVGVTDEGRGLARIIGQPARGFSPVGYVRTAASPGALDGLPVVSDVDGLLSAIRAHGIECVFVASTAVTPDEMFQVVRACRQGNIEMRVSANLPEILTSRLSIQQIDRVMSFSLRPARLTGSQAALKRTSDLLLASLACLVTLPFMALIALAIWAFEGRPILFRQQRVTKDGGVFTMYKFRTMVRDADSDRMIDLTKPFFKMRDDPRLTRIGRLLRSLSLDELPQLWNVIEGKMSLVGPRALRVEQIASDPRFLAPRHDVKAGVTGWWQIHGRNEIDYPEAVRMDLFYIENWSLSLDLYILLKTVGVILSRKGAY